MTRTYRGRFAPSPTGLLHLGSIACAMSSWLDARAHDGEWLVRIEDIDPFRDIPGVEGPILRQLAAFDLVSDRPVVRQSDRTALYEAAIDRLKDQGAVYGCCCSRHEVLAADERLGLPAGVYPGTCRQGTHGRAIRSWRFRTNHEPITFTDRRCGLYTQDVEAAVGDFVVRRGDGCWAYQLAVVVDDAEQGITDVVRGEDLLDNTPRQIALQRALGVAQPQYLHIGLIRDAQGDKLSKQTGAVPVDVSDPLAILEELWVKKGFPRLGADTLTAFWQQATILWRSRWVKEERAN